MQVQIYLNNDLISEVQKLGKTPWAEARLDESVHKRWAELKQILFFQLYEQIKDLEIIK